MACSWTLNGLHSSPDKGASSKQLINAILPHVERADADPDILMYGSPTVDEGAGLNTDASSDSDHPHRTKRRRVGNSTAPASPYGLMFFRTMRIGAGHPVPRFSKGAFISENAFRHFFGIELDEIETEFFRGALVAPTHPNRVRNKTRRTTRYHNWGQDADVNVFQLSRRGYRLASPSRDDGSDLSEREDEPGPVDIDAELRAVWRQFLLDITSKAPNTKRANKPSHIVLTDEQRTTVNEATYKNRRLSAYFRDCQWRFASEEEWDRVFGQLWPKPRSQLAGKVQNYPSTLYFPQWRALMEKADATTIKAMRTSLKKKFDQLYWMPYAQRDRIWDTAYTPKFSKLSGLPPSDPAPQIVINPHFETPLW